MKYNLFKKRKKENESLVMGPDYSILKLNENIEKRKNKIKRLDKVKNFFGRSMVVQMIVLLGYFAFAGNNPIKESDIVEKYNESKETLTILKEKKGLRNLIGKPELNKKIKSLEYEINNIEKTNTEFKEYTKKKDERNELTGYFMVGNLLGFVLCYTGRRIARGRRRKHKDKNYSEMKEFFIDSKPKD